MNLIIFSGLPGTGKTTLAEATGREVGVPVFSIAWLLGVCQPLGILGDKQANVGYKLLSMLAQRQLALGQSVILDSMAGSNELREGWRHLACSYGSSFIAIETTCRDSALHRSRVENRDDDIPGWPSPRWDHVEAMLMKFEPWREEHLSVDAGDSLDENLDTVRHYIKSRAGELS